jgi:hypothetical protein
MMPLIATGISLILVVRIVDVMNLRCCSMPLIGWVFLVLAFGLVVGSLFMLRDSTNMPLSDDQREKIRKRQSELEAEEDAEKEKDE